MTTKITVVEVGQSDQALHLLTQGVQEAAGRLKWPCELSRVHIVPSIPWNRLGPFVELHRERFMGNDITLLWISCTIPAAPAVRRLLALLEERVDRWSTNLIEIDFKNKCRLSVMPRLSALGMLEGTWKRFGTTAIEVREQVSRIVGADDARVRSLSAGREKDILSCGAELLERYVNREPAKSA